MIFHGISDDSLPHPSFRSHLWAGRHFRALMLTFALIWLVLVPTVRGWGLPRPTPHETKESPWHYLTLLFFVPILSLTLSLNSSFSWPPNSLSSRINNQWAAALEETLVLVLIVTLHTQTFNIQCFGEDQPLSHTHYILLHDVSYMMTYYAQHKNNSRLVATKYQLLLLYYFRFNY